LQEQEQFTYSSVKIWLSSQSENAPGKKSYGFPNGEFFLSDVISRSVMLHSKDLIQLKERKKERKKGWCLFCSE